MIFSSLLAASNGGFWAPIANPLAAVLAFFYDLVPNYGLAIVLLTIAMMIVLTPLTIKQTRSMLVMQKLQPEMKKLQEQHKNDRQALNEAVMALYKEHNASPLGGCLPMLLPFPLFIGLLRVLEGLSHTVTTTVNGHKVTTAVPKYLTSHTRMYQDIVKAHGQLDAFGMNLAKSARNVGGGFGHTVPYFVLLLVMVGTQFYQQYQLTSKNPAVKSQPGQAMMMKFIPIFFGFISLNFPAGVVVYWTVSNIIRIGQQWALYRYDPKVKALVVKDIKEIEAKTREIDARKAPIKPSSRGGLRDMLNNAREAAADRRNLGGKNAADPGARPAGDKAGGPGRPGRTPPGKATSGTSGVNKSPRPASASGKSGGPQKGAPPRPAAATPRPGTAKTAPVKAGGPRANAGKPGGSKPTAGKPGGLKPGAGKPSGAKPGAAKGSGTSGGARPGSGTGSPATGATPGTAGAATGAMPGTAGAAKAGDSSKGAPKIVSPPKVVVPPKVVSPPPVVSPPKVVSPTGSAPGGPADGANGAAAKASAVAKEGNGAGSPATAQGGAANGGANGAQSNGAPKGRTGGGSARNVTSSSRRRRRGK